MTSRTPLAAVVALLLPGAAFAQDFGFNYGATLTSDYISRGETQSDGDPALQGYIEAHSGIVYGGVWASTVDFGDDDNVEFDVYLGVRPSFGDLSVDLNYTRYLYDDSGDCCGEIGLALAYPLSETAEVGGAFYVDPENDEEWLEITGGFIVMQDYTLDGTVGTDFGSLDIGKTKFAWDFGVARTFAEFATVDLRYHDSNDDPSRLVLSLSVDF